MCLCLGNGQTLSSAEQEAHEELGSVAVQHSNEGGLAVTLLIYLLVLLQFQTYPALATSHFPCFSREIMPQPISSCGKKSFLSFRPNMPFLYFIPLLWVTSDLLHSFFLPSAIALFLNSYTASFSYLARFSLFSSMLNSTFSFIFFHVNFSYLWFFFQNSFLHKHLVMKCPERNFPLSRISH